MTLLVLARRRVGRPRTPTASMSPLPVCIDELCCALWVEGRRAVCVALAADTDVPGVRARCVLAEVGSPARPAPRLTDEAGPMAAGCKVDATTADAGGPLHLHLPWRSRVAASPPGPCWSPRAATSTVALGCCHAATERLRPRGFVGWAVRGGSTPARPGHAPDGVHRGQGHAGGGGGGRASGASISNSLASPGVASHLVCVDRLPHQERGFCTHASAVVHSDRGG